MAFIQLFLIDKFFSLAEMEDASLTNIKNNLFSLENCH